MTLPSTESKQALMKMNSVSSSIAEEPEKNKEEFAIEEKPPGYSGIDGEIPRDTYNMAYMIFFLQGMGTLFPWNCIITANQYYTNSLQATDAESTDFSKSYLSYFTSTFQVFNIVCLIIGMRFQHTIPITLRIKAPLSLQFLIFLCITCLVKTSISAETLFGSTLFFIVLSGSATAFFQGGIFGISGSMSMRYVQAVMNGQALGGIVVSVINVFAILSAKGKGTENKVLLAQNSALIFFSISTLVLFLCIISYFVLVRLPLVQYYMKIRSDHSGDKGEKNFNLLEIWKQIWKLSLCVGFNFFITLLIFPVVTIDVALKTAHKSFFHTSLLIPVYVFVLFNCGYWIGRFTSGFVQYPKPGKLFYALCFSRVIFVPLFLICKSIDNAWPYIFMIIFSISNGYFGSLCMMFGPADVPVASKEAASSIMVLSLATGITLGCCFSFGLKAILCSCNPFIN